MAVSLPGTNDSTCLIASTSGYSAYPVTITLWTKRSSWSTQRGGGLGDSASADLICFYHTNAPAVVGRIGDSGVESNDTASGTPATSAWVFQAIKADSSKVYASIAGNAWPSGTAHGLGSFVTVNQAVLGRFANNEALGYLVAEVAHCAIFTSALSDAQIAALAGGKNPIDYGPADYWTLDSTLANEVGGRNSFSYSAGSPSYTTGPTIDAPAAASARRRIVVVV